MENIIKGIKCTIITEIYASGNYRTFGCILNNPSDEKNIVLNKYGNFVIAGDIPYLKKGETYTLDLKEVTHRRYGTQYIVDTVKDYEMVENLEELTIDQSKEILTKFTTETQANTLLSVYPNFISMVINGNVDDIDVKKLKNIKEYRLSCYVREINTRFKYYYILIHYKHYDLTIKECQDLDTEYGSVEKVGEAIEETPYVVLIDVLHRGFLNVDKLLMKIRPELKETSDRIEHIALHILELNEEDDNTYMDANTMAGFCAEIDRDCIKHIKKTCVNSNKIWYDDTTKRIAKMDTYMAESTIASFFTNILHDSANKWNFKWENYTKIKDGTLTEEQAQVLNQICENRIVILNSGAGTGKTSSMMALISMLEDNSKTYTLLAPTGRAAKRLAEQTHRKASTVHKASAMSQGEGIDSDVIICDEWSMYGLEHMMMIIKACINPDVRFVFSGDIHQLPSIALGCVMRDFIDSGIIPVVTLTKVFRYKDGGLSAVVKDVYDKRPFTNSLKLENNKCVLGVNHDYTFIQADGTVDQIIDTYMEKINSGIKPIDIALITPWNVKEFGTYNINNLIQSAINPARKNEKVITRSYGNGEVTFRQKDIIMNTKNNYKVPTYEGYKKMLEEIGEVDLSLIKEESFVGVFNGDIGRVLEITDQNIMIAQFDENMVVFSRDDCANLVLGYAGTIHKYQGSQCPHVIMLTLKAHEKSYNNNLLYTGLSRASLETTHIAHLSVVNNSIGVDGNENRQTQLKDFIIEYWNNIKDTPLLERCNDEEFTITEF